jgi:hypothetical protein
MSDKVNVYKWASLPKEVVRPGVSGLPSGVTRP